MVQVSLLRWKLSAQYLNLVSVYLLKTLVHHRFFEVSDGELVSAFFSGSLGASANSDNVFNLFIDFSDDNPVNFGSLLIVGGSPGSIDGGVITFEKSQDNPQATVPEPASLIGILTIGAATVFGRCKRHSTT